MRIQYLFALALALPILLGNSAQAAIILALNQSNQLLRFDSSSPGTTTTPVAVNGLLAGERLAGIDVRPATNQVYGLAVNGTAGRLYTINSETGAATFASAISQSLSGTFFGVDFNPVPDRLRVVSDAGQNLRIEVGSGTSTVDTSVAFNASDANAGTPPNIVASAYINSVAGATSTTLYGLDVSTQSLVIQNPPNNGTLNTVGGLGTILSQEASFDVDPISNQAFAVLNGFEFSTVNLTTGTSTFIGNINTGSNIIGITSISAVPEPASIALMSLAVTMGGFVNLRQMRRRRFTKMSMETEIR
jgi:Domain of unknown function (DUF4394)